MTFAFFAGLAAGLVHVFSGPDHLAAVAPLAAGNRHHSALGEMSPGEGWRQRVDGWKTGLQWGAGHTAGVLLVAALLLLMREQLPLDAISAYSERLVGVALIAVGGWGIWKARQAAAPHSHPGASFAMGTLHGLAGSSHLFGVLPALTFSLRSDAALYLSGFGIGAIAGMTAFAAGIRMAAIRFGNLGNFLYASSAAALVVGGVWLVGR
jgi:hypothetical protein